jgi:hypothetical protein
MPKFDFNHPKMNPRTGMMEPRIVDRPEDHIELMNRQPGKTGWIIMLQNRVNLNSVGNIRYAKKVWYDRETRSISDDENMEDPIHFMLYQLPHCGRPGGWMYPEDFTKYTHRHL